MANTMANVGIIGCGNISEIYLQARRKFPALNIVACADLVLARAEEKATLHDIAALSVEEMLADSAIDLCINLTIPGAHANVDLAVLEAGKSVYSEKPLAISRADGRTVLERAAGAGLRVGCAPDTFLGGGLQTCRKLIDDGWIGEPVAATAFMISRGHEHWHPDPGFYYQPGGGPMFDMGPYYLTALISMLGPVARVSGSTRTTFAQRTITSEPKYGQQIEVRVPTHVTGLLDFVCGATATLIMTFDVWSATLPRLEIYGTEGSLQLPDPNTFGGPVRVKRGREAEWSEIPMAFGYTDNSRGIGVADMAVAIGEQRPHRASAELAYHVLDIMCAMHEASDQSSHIFLESTCERPAALRMGLMPGEVY